MLGGTAADDARQPAASSAGSTTARWWPRATGGPGFLLAPWTAEAIAGELNGAPLPEAELVEVR